MMSNESSASPDADSSTFGHPEESEDPVLDTVLRQIRINTPSLDLDASVVLAKSDEKQMEGRGLYRLAFAILLLVIGLLLDARRIVDAASLMLL